MKTILEVFILVKEELTKMVDREEGTLSLCTACNNLQAQRKIDLEEVIIFHKYYLRSKRGQKWFYDYLDFKVQDKSQFGWPMSDSNSRMIWLNRNINKLKNS